MASSDRWKSVERQLARLIGGRRTNRDRGERVEDITHPILSVEVKHGKQIPVFVTRVLEQANLNSPEDKIPVTILHPFRAGLEDSVVCMSLASLTRLLLLAAQSPPVSSSHPAQQSGES